MDLPLAVIPPTVAFGARNCLRLDFDDLIFFVPVFRNRDSLFPHNHEDTLSYVIFAGMEEVLVDPGRSSFQPKDQRAVLAESHNGLIDADNPISPMRRFYFNRRMRAEPVDVEVRPLREGGVQLTATNCLLTVQRTVSFLPRGPNVVAVEERLE